jgi:hypothetical protein
VIQIKVFLEPLLEGLLKERKIYLIIFRVLQKKGFWGLFFGELLEMIYGHAQEYDT